VATTRIVSEGTTVRTAPSLKQGCLMSAGAFVMALGGCVAAGVFNSDVLLELSMVVFALAGVVGLVLLIARFDAWLKRD
jgi:hypothetical protein